MDGTAVHFYDPLGQECSDIANLSFPTYNTLYFAK